MSYLNQYIGAQNNLSLTTNNAGGVVFNLPARAQFRRFLILGSAGGSYYASERELTNQNLDVIKQYIADDWAGALETVIAVSTNGLAAKQSPTLLAFALLYVEKRTFRYAFGVEVKDAQFRAAFPKVIRTLSHLYEFTSYVKALTGHVNGGGSLGKCVGDLFHAWGPEKLSYQVLKYRQRNGFSVRDLLRIYHPKANTPEMSFILAYGAGKHADYLDAQESVMAFEHLKMLGDVATADQLEDLMALLTPGTISWEMLPTHLLTDAKTWKLLLPTMPLTALVRNLGRMTSLGVFNHVSWRNAVVGKLGDREYIRNSRLHPFTILQALGVYRQGHGDKGDLRWEPEPSIVAALHDAFYLAFNNVEPTEKRLMLALDKSSSMNYSVIGSGVTAMTGALAMAMVTNAAEENVTTVAFDAGPGGLVPLQLPKNGDLFAATTALVRTWRNGGTNCSLPIALALRNKEYYDAFVVYTDNETWAGHPVHEVLADYRRQVNRNAKLVVVGMTSTGFTINNPDDPNGLDVVGFDASAPQAISSFISGFTE